jgi:anti-anti-sigma factor
MQFNTLKSGNQLIIQTTGRLDASWSDYFTDFFMDLIRNGEHQLIMDATHLEFLSSAGIRSLIRVSKELKLVSGSFAIIRPTEFVFNTLKMTGLSAWIQDDADLLPELNTDESGETVTADENWFVIDSKASLILRIHDSWIPFRPVETDFIKPFDFPADSFALGIGSPQTDHQLTEPQFGEFLVAAGHLVYQNPDERSRPDYLLPLGDYIPQLMCIQALSARGSFSHLYRFKPEGDKFSYSLADLSLQALEELKTDLVAVLILAEVDGLVGSKLIQSPAHLKSNQLAPFPEIRNWLGFSGERAYPNEQVLVVGFVGNAEKVGKYPLFKALPSNPVICGHFHASVFPYQALPNGRLDLFQQVSKFFNGSPPRNLYHLIEDMRPIAGIGASSFIRGAMWCSNISEKEAMI